MPLNYLAAGDPAILHQMIMDKSIDMEKVKMYSKENIVKFCASTGITTSEKSKV